MTFNQSIIICLICLIITVVVCGHGFRRDSNNSCERCPLGTYQNTSGMHLCYRFVMTVEMLCFA